MTDADYRSTWVQERINELHGPRRLTYTEIARKAGVSKQYFGQVKDGAPPSDRLIQGLCDAFGFEWPKPPAGKQVLDVVKSPVGIPSSTELELARMVQDLAMANAALREEVAAMRGTITTQSNVLSLLTDTIGGHKEALARIEKKLDGLPARLKT